METKTSKGKEIRIPGPDHPIKISPAAGRVACNYRRQDSLLNRRERFGWRRRDIRRFTTFRAYDADMSLLVRTKHYTYCPYKGDCTYYSIPIGGSKSEYAVWDVRKKPYEAVASIKEYLAFLSLTGLMQSK